MKKIILSALALAFALPSFAQWSYGTGTIYTTSDKLGIGISSPTTKFGVQGTVGASTPAANWTSTGDIGAVVYSEGENKAVLNAVAASSATLRPVFFGRRSRGTLASPTALQNNDQILSFLSSGYDGSNFQNAGGVDFLVDGTPSSGNIPTKISFITGSNAGNRAARLTVTSSGLVGIGTTTPDYTLTVAGLIKSSNLYSNGNSTYVGAGAGNSTMTGGGNTLLGTSAGSTLTTGGFSTIIGWAAGAITTGNNNIILGTVNVNSSNRFPGQALTSGTDNLFIGNGAGSYVSTGAFNIAIGIGALTAGNGSDNTVVGPNAGYQNSTGTYNAYLATERDTRIPQEAGIPSSVLTRV
ncbi:hypothetical protein [Mucilaginibacter sp. HD30]